LNTEINKIDFYFSEGKKLWQAMPEQVVSRDFFVLWENIQQPKPFSIDVPELELFGQKYPLAGDDGESRVGFFHWDTGEMCAVLSVESESWEQKFLLTFDNGQPRIYENEPVMLEKSELEHGEKLEIIYDVIALVKRSDPYRDILDLTKKEYLEALGGLEGVHDAITLKAMRRLPAFSLKKLLRNAADDMALDELSNQLSLPLDGSYGRQSDLLPPEEEEDVLPSREIRSAIQIRTPWEVASELTFLGMSCKNTYEAEKFYLLSFKNAEFVGESSDNEITVRFPVDEEWMVSDGDVLRVYLHGSREQFGTFKVDLFDGVSIFGRLRWQDCDDILKHKDELFARPRKSPREFIYQSIDGLADVFRQQKQDTVITGALRAVLGLDEAMFHMASGTSADAPVELDASQIRAWACAIDERNPVTLIQGPPGTGKTSVLEKVVRHLCLQKKRILVAAPSNTAVDNICRRLMADLPVIRFGRNMDSIAPDVCRHCWIGGEENVRNFTTLRQRMKCGGVFAGTHIGLIRDDIISEDIRQNGLYDVIIYDEAGMASMQEFLLSCRMGKRVVLFGDHHQLPPFPLPQLVIERNRAEYGVINKRLWAITRKSALEWLAAERDFPIVMLQCSYRCQNPRLLRFASTLFYDAGVRASEQAEYYQLPFLERQRKFPAAALRLLRTSGLASDLRQEMLVIEGCKPGLENRLEAALCCREVYAAMAQYPLMEITVIAPYRRQVALIRKILSAEIASGIIGRPVSDKEWENFLFTRIATVDSFQGGESDIVIISYVRSPKEGGIGFVDDANRINVAHTRCRREMVVVGDMERLKSGARNNIFVRMERAFQRDGQIIDIEPDEAEELLREYPEETVDPEDQSDCA